MKSNTTCKPKCDTGYSLKGSSYFLADPVVKSCGVDSETVKASKCLSAAKSLGVAGDQKTMHYTSSNIRPRGCFYKESNPSTHHVFYNQNMEGSNDGSAVR